MCDFMVDYFNFDLAGRWNTEDKLGLAKETAQNWVSLAKKLTEDTYPPKDENHKKFHRYISLIVHDGNSEYRELEHYIRLVEKGDVDVKVIWHSLYKTVEFIQHLLILNIALGKGLDLK